MPKILSPHVSCIRARVPLSVAVLKLRSSWLATSARRARGRSFENKLQQNTLPERNVLRLFSASDACVLRGPRATFHNVTTSSVPYNYHAHDSIPLLELARNAPERHCSSICDLGREKKTAFSTRKHEHANARPIARALVRAENSKLAARLVGTQIHFKLLRAQNTLPETK